MVVGLGPREDNTPSPGSSELNGVVPHDGRAGAAALLVDLELKTPSGTGHGTIVPCTYLGFRPKTTYRKIPTKVP